MRLVVFFGCSLALAACAGDKSADSGTAAAGTGGGEDGADGDGGSDGEDGLVEVFPDGTSTWSGTARIAGGDVPVSAELTRSGAALTAIIAPELGGTALRFAARGRVDLETGRVSLAPGDWQGEDPELEVVGLMATFDAAAAVLEGTLRDAATWEDPETQVGAARLSTTSAAARVDPAGLAETRMLDTARSFSGVFACTATERPIRGSLERGADGVVRGEIRFDEADGSPVGAFPVEGVEAGGGLTLQPLPWTELADGATPYLNFWIDGRFEGDDFIGTAYQNIGAVCMDDAVLLHFD